MQALKTTNALPATGATESDVPANQSHFSQALAQAVQVYIETREPLIEAAADGVDAPYLYVAVYAATAALLRENGMSEHLLEALTKPDYLTPELEAYLG